MSSFARLMYNGGHDSSRLLTCRCMDDCLTSSKCFAALPVFYKSLTDWSVRLYVRDTQIDFWNERTEARMRSGIFRRMDRKAMRRPVYCVSVRVLPRPYYGFYGAVRRPMLAEPRPASTTLRTNVSPLLFIDAADRSSTRPPVASSNGPLGSSYDDDVDLNPSAHRPHAYTRMQPIHGMFCEHSCNHACSFIRSDSSFHIASP